HIAPVQGDESRKLRGAPGSLLESTAGMHPTRSMVNAAGGMPPILAISKLTKTYPGGLQALKGVDLEIEKGEIFALLGPNGAGKTTLIGIVCGLVNASSGSVVVAGHDIIRDYRAARYKIGLVPQELTADMFETVWATVSFSRGLFGRPSNPEHLEKVLRQ